MRRIVGLGVGVVLLGCSGATDLLSGAAPPVSFTRGRQLGDGRLVFPDMVCEVAVSPDDQRVAVAVQYGATQVLDVATGKPAYPLDAKVGSACAMAWSPDGTRLAVGSGGGLWLLDGATGKILGGQEITWAFYSIAWSADGAWYAGGGNPHDGLTIADGKTGAVAWQGALLETAIEDVAWSLDNKTVYLAGTPDVQRFDVATHQLVAPLPGHTEPVATVSMSPDGTLWSGASDGKILTWDPAGQRAEVPPTLNASLLRGDPARGLAFAVRNDRIGVLGPGGWTAKVRMGQSLSVGAGLVVIGELQRVDLFDRATGAPKPRGAGHTAGVTGVAWTAAGVVSTGGDERLLRWDPTAGTATEAAIGGLVGTDGADSVVVGDGALSWGTIKVTGEYVEPAVAVAADGQRLAAVQKDGSTHVFDRSGVDGLQIPAGSVKVTALAFSPDHLRLALGDEEGDVNIVDAQTGARIDGSRTDGAVSALAFDPTGRMLLMSGANTTQAVAVDAATGLEIGRLDEGVPVTALAWSPDGQEVAVGRPDGAIGMWAVGAP